MQNRTTPAPIFNQRKRQRQAMYSDIENRQPSNPAPSVSGAGLMPIGGFGAKGNQTTHNFNRSNNPTSFKPGSGFNQPNTPSSNNTNQSRPSNTSFRQQGSSSNNQSTFRSNFTANSTNQSSNKGLNQSESSGFRGQMLNKSYGQNNFFDGPSDEKYRSAQNAPFHNTYGQQDQNHSNWSNSGTNNYFSGQQHQQHQHQQQQQQQKPWKQGVHTVNNYDGRFQKTPDFRNNNAGNHFALGNQFDNNQSTFNSTKGNKYNSNQSTFNSTNENQYNSNQSTYNSTNRNQYNNNESSFNSSNGNQYNSNQSTYNSTNGNQGYSMFPNDNRFNQSAAQNTSFGSRFNAQSSGVSQQIKPNVPVEYKTKPKEVDKSLRIITTDITRMKEWSDNKGNSMNLLFEIFGMVDSAVLMISNGAGKEFVLNDGSTTVPCLFYEIDRTLPRLTRGQLHRCVGTFGVKSGKMKCVVVRPATNEERKTAMVASSLSDKSLQIFTKVLSEQ